MLIRHRFAVPHPDTDSLAGEPFFQLGLSAGPDILEQLRPDRHAIPPDQPTHLLAEIRVAELSEPWEHEEILDPTFMQCPQVRHQFRKQGQFPELRFDRRDSDSEPLPINMAPLQGKRLRRCPETSPAAQGNDGSQFDILCGSDHRFDLLRRYEPAAAFVHCPVTLHLLKRVASQDLRINGFVQKTFGDREMLVGS